MTVIIRATVEDLEAEIAALIEQFPVLADVESADCGCPGCTTEDVRQAHGSDAAAAWARIAQARFLLGQD